MAKTYPLTQVRILRILTMAAFAWMLCFTQTGYAQVTTSSMSGTVLDESGEPLIGANIVAVHEPSGTTYGTATDIDGNYRIPGMRVGGPYKLTVTYTGFAEQSYDNIMLRLGEAQRRNFTLTQSSVELDAVTVTGSAGVSGQSAGTSTQITGEQIDVLPTLNRNINDFLRLSPQSSIYNGEGITFGGTNNRYNAIYIDGAVNNDVFGLAASGTNGGQTGISPFSIDIIDQFQVSLSPYDVTLGGFAGAGVNAVTKSGTNTFGGTAYFFTQNESLAGKTNGVLTNRLQEGDPDFEPTKLDEFTQRVYGASLSGPIVKNKAFFFANVELQDDETPIPFEFGTYSATPGRYTTADLDALRSTLIQRYGYDPGGYLSSADQLEGVKIFGKIDWNLNDNHRLTLRHQYTKAEQSDRIGSSANTIYFANSGIYFPSTTNSSAIELNSRFGAKFSNNLILGYTNVNDDRDGFGDFPYLYIEDESNGLLRIGTEEFSTANQLKQKIFTITDNFKIYSGDHTFTVGTHNEFYDIYNVFIGQNYGTYRYDNLDDFLNDAGASEYDRAYSLVDDITGDGTAAAAAFNAMQLGFYVQDEWSVTNKFTLTGGVRLDIPIITDDPIADDTFNLKALPLIRQKYDIANDAEAGKAPDGQLMVSPRLGFEYDVTGNRSTIVRGGLGIFTSRIPFVWPGAMFNNNGITLGRVSEADIDSVVFIADVNNQYTNPNFTSHSGQIDLFTKDFKYPQVFRTNLAVDKTFGSGWQVTLEGVYTKKLNDVLYTNINSNPDVKFNLTNNGGDDRPVYVGQNIYGAYGSGVYLASNTDEGNAYNISASVSKNFNCGVNVYAAYSYGDAHSINDGTSSQNSSQWRGQVSVDGRNFPAYGRSDYAVGHRIISSLTYKHDWTKDGGFATMVNLTFNGQSGTAFSYVIGGSGARNLNGETGSNSRNRSLVYIPTDINDINLVDYTAGGTTVTAAQQWANLNAVIESDKSLSEHRGEYAEKNGGTAPFTGMFDLAIRQDLGKKIGNGLHRLQLSLDIFNVANLLNSEWGTVYTVIGDFNNFYLYQFDGYESDGTTPRLTYRLGDKTGKDLYDIAGTSSRWRMRLGVRYIFN